MASPLLSHLVSPHYHHLSGHYCCFCVDKKLWAAHCCAEQQVASVKAAAHTAPPLALQV